MVATGLPFNFIPLKGDQALFDAIFSFLITISLFKSTIVKSASYPFLIKPLFLIL